jgi:uncharacterized protein YybS (DUF2232 family)
LPFLYYATKLGLYGGAKLGLMAAVMFGLIGRLTAQPYGFLFGVEFILLGLALSEILRARFSLGYTVLLGTAFLLALSFTILFFVALSRDMGPLEMMRGYLQAQLRGAMETYGEMGVPGEEADAFRDYGERVIATLSRIYLSLMVIGVGFSVWVNVALAGPLCRRGGLPYPDFIPMDRWRAPDTLVWGVIGSGFALILFSGAVRWLAINVLILLMTLYVFQGLCIVIFFLNKYSVPSWTRVIIYFLIVAQQLLLVVLSLVGLFDQWIDFRKVRGREGADSG